MEQKQEPNEPSLEDVGTRHQHLLEYKESLDICIDILKRNGGKGASAKLTKLESASEVITATLDAFSGYASSDTEYKLYQLLNSVPKTKNDLIAIGGEPLT